MLQYLGTRWQTSEGKEVGLDDLEEILNSPPPTIGAPPGVAHPAFASKKELDVGTLEERLQRSSTERSLLQHLRRVSRDAADNTAAVVQTGLPSSHTTAVQTSVAQLPQPAALMALSANPPAADATLHTSSEPAPAEAESEAVALAVGVILDVGAVASSAEGSSAHPVSPAGSAHLEAMSPSTALRQLEALAAQQAVPRTEAASSSREAPKAENHRLNDGGAEAAPLVGEVSTAAKPDGVAQLRELLATEQGNTGGAASEGTVGSTGVQPPPGEPRGAQRSWSEAVWGALPAPGGWTGLPLGYGGAVAAAKQSIGAVAPVGVDASAKATMPTPETGKAEEAPNAAEAQPAVPLSARQAEASPAGLVAPVLLQSSEHRGILSWLGRGSDATTAVAPLVPQAASSSAQAAAKAAESEPAAEAQAPTATQQRGVFAWMKGSLGQEPAARVPNLASSSPASTADYPSPVTAATEAQSGCSAGPALGLDLRNPGAAADLPDQSAAAAAAEAPLSSSPDPPSGMDPSTSESAEGSAAVKGPAGSPAQPADQKGFLGWVGRGVLQGSTVAASVVGAVAGGALAGPLGMSAGGAYHYYTTLRGGPAAPSPDAPNAAASDPGAHPANMSSPIRRRSSSRTAELPVSFAPPSEADAPPSEPSPTTPPESESQNATHSSSPREKARAWMPGVADWWAPPTLEGVLDPLRQLVPASMPALPAMPAFPRTLWHSRAQPVDSDGKAGEERNEGAVPLGGVVASEEESPGLSSGGASGGSASGVASVLLQSSGEPAGQAGMAMADNAEAVIESAHSFSSAEECMPEIAANPASTATDPLSAIVVREEVGS